jgi:toxin FitB
LNYLIDTNVVSETRRTRPDPRVQTWFNAVDPNALFISVLTLGEIARGIAKRERTNAVEAASYRRWLESLRSDFLDRILIVDDDIAEMWGRLTARRTLPIVDGLLAATALVKSLTFVTRDVRDVAGTGASVLNPWQT